MLQHCIGTKSRFQPDLVIFNTESWTSVESVSLKIWFFRDNVNVRKSSAGGNVKSGEKEVVEVTKFQLAD